MMMIGVIKQKGRKRGNLASVSGQPNRQAAGPRQLPGQESEG